VIACDKSEIFELQDYFKLDTETLNDAKDLDDTVQYTNFLDYDFMSFVFPIEQDGDMIPTEINIYFSNNYTILVMPNKEYSILKYIQNIIDNKITKIIKKQSFHISFQNRVLYIILDEIISGLSRTIERIEDEVESLINLITEDINFDEFDILTKMRSKAYEVKKQIRALSILGDRLQLDDNDLIIDKQSYLFHNIDTRLNSLYKFSESVYLLSEELMRSYDAKLAQRTNQLVTRLTSITIIMGIWTVVGGIYGMNFEHIPFAKVENGFVFVIGLLTIFTVSLYALFKYKKWY
jgi:magnesium transporter